MAEIAYHGTGQSVHLRLMEGTALRVDRRAAEADLMPLAMGDLAVATYDPAHARILGGGPAQMQTET